MRIYTTFFSHHSNHNHHHHHLWLMVFLLPVFLMMTPISDADAIKSKGTPLHKFGADTKHIVCGDRLCSESRQQQQHRSKAIDMDAYFEDIRNNSTQLAYFFKHMPKGADLHNHLAGNTHPDILIQIASDNQLCFNLNTAKLVKKSMAVNEDDALCPENHELVSKVYENKSWYDLLYLNWSTHNFKKSSNNHYDNNNNAETTSPLPQSGHDHFFAVFDKINEANNDVTTTLGHWKIVAEEQNMQYMETMFNDPYIWQEINELSNKISIVNTTLDFDDAYNTLQNEIKKRKTIETSAKNIMHYEKESREFCIAKQYYSCDMPFRYIFQVLRAAEINNVFTQMVVGFETAKQSEHFVAVNMVQPEDDENSIKNYSLHMEMLSFLKEKYPDVNITLHAGELWPSLPNINPQSDMTFHIHDAIKKGGAQRIGHGVDIQTEVKHFPDLPEIMLSENVAVEINLNSNYVILDMRPGDHPILFYLDNDIPIVLATDDPGILLSNMTHEYVTAAQNYPQIKYSDFKKMVRNSLEYSFLTGRSLWVDGHDDDDDNDLEEYQTKLPQCNKHTSQVLNCWSYGIDQKATLQYELESKLEEFENSLIK